MDLRLLEKFFKKQCSPEEVKIVLEWFRHEDFNSKISDEMKALWDSFEDKRLFSDYNSNKLLKDLHSKINIDKDAYHNRSRRKNDFENRNFNPHFVLKASAFVMLLIIIATSAWYIFNPTTSYSDSFGTLQVAVLT